MKKHTFQLWPAFMLGLGIVVSPVLSATQFQSTESTQSNGSYEIQVDFSEIQILENEINGEVFHEFLLDESGYYNKPGAPDLPVVSQLIEIPDQAGVQLRLVSEEFDTIYNVNPFPSQERMHTENELPEEWLLDEKVYLANEFFPAISYDLGDPALMRNHRVVKSSFFPVQVNPVTGEARIWSSMTFEINFDGVNTINQKETQLADNSGSISRMLNKQILNPEREAQGAISDFLLDPGDLPGNYVIFGYSSVFNDPAPPHYFKQYLEWKKRRGHNVVLVDENDVDLGTASSIRSRINSEYYGSNPVDFVVLLGDVDGNYPIATGPTNFSSGNGGYDHYYSCIEGSDILGDVAVGRLSADNAQELFGILAKVTRYESEPYIEDLTWLNHSAYLVGSSTCALSMRNNLRNVATEMVEKRGYNDIDTTWCSSSAPVIPWMNEGISHYAYRGWIGMEGLSTGDISNLSQGDRTPVVTIYTCSTGDFNYSDDYSEAFLRAGNVNTSGGAVACIGLATSSTHTRDNNVLCAGFYGGLLEYDVPEVGSCMLQGKYELYQAVPYGLSEATNFANWANLMGDPGTVMWAGSLGELDFDVPSSLPSSTNSLTVNVTTHGAPAEGIIVCAYQDQGTGELQSVALTNASGQVILPLGGLDIGTLLLTASHRRFAPQMVDVDVVGTVTGVELIEWDINNTTTIQPGLINQELNFSLHNAGTTNLTNVSVSAAIDAEFANVVSAAISLEEISVGETISASGILLTAVADLTNDTLLPLMLQIDSDQGTFEQLVALRAAAPVLAITESRSSLSLGHIGTVQVTLENSAGINAENVFASLSSQDSDVQVRSGNVKIGDLAIDAVAKAQFNVEVSKTAINGMEVPMTLNWTSNGTIIGSLPILVDIGERSVNDPSGDSYGYWAYEDNDSSYPEHPTYSWIDVGPGGNGSSVGLSDTADEGDDLVSLDMPFSFSFYGICYDEVTVSSNGFVTFNDTNSGETDFCNHPLPCAFGPDAMIAPMWDDRIMRAYSSIYYWYDSANHRFVISWNDVDANYSGSDCTFQLALYDPDFYPTSTGDGPFLMQYQDFNDDQESIGGWGPDDFQMCTIGIKDHTALEGLTLRYAGTATANGTMTNVTDGTAIYFTTGSGTYSDTVAPLALITPIVNQYDPPYVAIDVEARVWECSGLSSVDCYWALSGDDWNVIPMTASGDFYVCQLPVVDDAGGNVSIFVRSTDASSNSNVSDTNTLVVQCVTPPPPPPEPETIYFDDFSENQGWSFEGQWERGTAQSGGGEYGNPDPGTDHTDTVDNYLLGYNIGGDYENNLNTTYWVTSPSYDLSDWENVRFDFWRYLGLEQDQYDNGYIDVWNGSSWINIWNNSTTITDAEWIYETYDVSVYADGNNDFKVRFGIGTSDSAWRYCGWNIDDLKLLGDSILPPPTLDPVTDLNIYTGSGVVLLTWTEVPGASSYKIYCSDDAYGTMINLGESVDAFFIADFIDNKKFYTVTAVN
jgi:hypothetical protein